MAEQTTIEGFEQQRIPAIERIANKFDEKRGIVGGLQDEMSNLAYKLREAMHENSGALDRQESENGEHLLIYKRGDYNIVVKGKETLKVKIKAASKGEEPED